MNSAGALLRKVKVINSDQKWFNVTSRCKHT